MRYFNLKVLVGKKPKDTFWEKITNKLLTHLVKLLTHLVPKANPTLEENLDYVKEWYIEYDDVEEYTNREVGVAENGMVVFKAPFDIA